MEQISPELEQMHPSEVANLLEASLPDMRKDLWHSVPLALQGEVLSYLHDDIRSQLINQMDESEVRAVTEHMDDADLAHVVDELPTALSDNIVDLLDSDRRQRLEATLSYAEDTAGRLMTTDLLSVRPDTSIAAVLRWLRRHETLPHHTDSLMVIDKQGHYLGTLAMDALVTADPELETGAVMSPDSVAIQADTSAHDVALLFERRDLMSLPVVDESNCLIGRITLYEVLDIIRDEAEEALLHSAGLDEEEHLFSPVLSSARRRGVWLGINLLTVFMAAWVIGQFEAALSQIVALAVLMPVVASMGGIAGSQTLTLTIRGLALNQIAASNTRWLLTKEVIIGALNGAVWAVVVAVVAYFWFGDIGLSGVIAAALILNLLAAAASGILVPLTLKRMGIDPALSGAVVLTTVTDIMGFLSFLGLATLFLL